MGIYWRTLLLAACVSLAATVSAQNCDRPISGVVLSDAFSSFELLDLNRDQAIRKYVSHNCLNTDQIFKLASLYTDEDERYQFATYAYDFVFDEAKYGRVGEALVYQDNRELFDEFLSNRRKHAAESVINRDYYTKKPQPSREPAYVEAYVGPLGCLEPMSEAQYLEVQRAMIGKVFDDAKMKTAKKMLDGQCITSNQITGLANLFELENNRLKLVKFAWRQTYDLGNFFKVTKLFEFENTSDNLRFYMEKNPQKGKGEITGTFPGPKEDDNPFSRSLKEKKGPLNCQQAMVEADFMEAYRLIRKQTFADTRLKLAKQVVEGNCTSTRQIKEIMLLFEEENLRLDFAKYAFDYAWDQDNYSLVNAALYDSSSVDELSDYLETKQK